MSASHRERDHPSAAERLQGRLFDSIDALRGLHSVSRLAFGPGDVVLRENEPSDAVFFVLKGVALAVRHRGGARRELARLGPGQCFGERGVLRDAPRSADIVAETDLEVLQVEASRFLAWYENHPELREVLGALEQVYWLEGGRPLSVYRSSYEGRPCVSTVYGDLASDGVISTKVLDEDIFVLSRAGRSKREVEFFASGPEWRALQLEDLVRSGSGPAREASLVGVVSAGSDADLGDIYQRVLRKDRLGAAELSRFRATGHLGGDGRLSRSSLVCQCLGLSREAVLEAAEQREYKYEAVRRGIGAGVVCGGCIPAVREALETTTPREPPVPHAAGLEKRSRLVARPFEPSYDARPLAEIRGDHQVHLLALGSLFAACGERFMIGTLLQAAPAVRDAALVADLEVFLEQESNHVSAHEPLNRLLAEEVFADCPRFQRLRQLAFTRLEHTRLNLRLAVCAAFEFSADCLFGLHFEEFAAREAHHTDREIEARLEASGALDLFQWHGIEELGHRHVAFDVMKAHGVGYATRLAGMLIVLFELSRVGMRVLPELFRKTTLQHRRAYLRRALVRPALLRRFPWKLLPFLAPGFHPSRVEYPPP